jgi:hypothetical protein
MIHLKLRFVFVGIFNFFHVCRLVCVCVCLSVCLSVTDNTQSHPLAYHARGLVCLCTEYADILCAGSDVSSPLIQTDFDDVTFVILCYVISCFVVIRSVMFVIITHQLGTCWSNSLRYTCVLLKIATKNTFA